MFLLFLFPFLAFSQFWGLLGRSLR
jgi:hypothetical protein